MLKISGCTFYDWNMWLPMFIISPYLSVKIHSYIIFFCLAIFALFHGCHSILGAIQPKYFSYCKMFTTFHILLFHLRSMALIIMFSLAIRTYTFLINVFHFSHTIYMLRVIQKSHICFTYLLCFIGKVIPVYKFGYLDFYFPIFLELIPLTCRGSSMHIFLGNVTTIP